MRVYLDDDLDSNLFIRLLSQSRHQVTSPRAIGNRGITDEEHLKYAADNLLVMLTANSQDYVLLHHLWLSQTRQHAGILIVYRENNTARDMSFTEISAAVTRLEKADVAVANGIHNLNFWRS